MTPENPEPAPVVVGDVLYHAHDFPEFAVVRAEVTKAGPVQITLVREGGYSTVDRIPRDAVDNPSAWAPWSRTEEGAKRTLVLRLRATLDHAQAQAEAADARLVAVSAAWPEAAS